MGRKTYPQQAELKTAILEVLERKPWLVLADVSHDTCVPLSTLYFWVNNITLNMRTPAYLEALRDWVEAHK